MWLWWVLLAVIVGGSLLIVLVPLRGPRIPIGGPDEQEIDRLLQEKAQALRALKDLEHDRVAGLLSEAEFVASRAVYLEKAAVLNRAIQALTGIDVERAVSGDNALAKQSPTRDEESR